MRILTMAVLFAVGGLALSARQSVSVDSQTATKSNSQFAQEVIATVYPDLAASRLSFVVDERRSDVAITAREVLDPFQLDSSRAFRSVVSTRIAFDDDGTWRSFDAEGPWVRSLDYSALREKVRRQPFQSASESEAWLNARGATYGPDRGVPVDDRLKRTDWARVLQANVFVQSVGFRWTDPPVAGRTAEVMPGWVAVMDVSRKAGGRESYEVLFEPFNGRIVRMRRE